MSQGNLRWNDLEVTWEDEDVDFYVVVNRPWPGERYVPERTIVFQMEPWCAEPWQTWGVRTWGEWAEPDPARFLQVRTHRTHLNNAFWQLRATYDELRTRPVRKTRLLSSICSGKYFDPGHVKRVDFLRFLEEKDDDVVRVDVWAHDNPLGFRSWVGPHPPGEKDAALLPYRYFFAAENNRERNFVTEKLWEPLLTETLCFYAGAPNVAEWVDPRAFVPLDLDDFEAAFRTMKEAILANEWEKRLDVLRREKRKVLEHYQFFPTLERILRHELRLPPRPTDEEVAYHKHFADVAGEEVRTAAFVHSFTRDGRTGILEEILSAVEESGLLAKLDRLYVVNVGGGIALSGRQDRWGGRVRHVAFSRDASRGEAPTLDLVRTFARFHSEARILYLHTKGASHDRECESVADWRRLMLHFLVERHAEALEALEGADVVGCNLLEEPRRHFSGNFWWANARHLRVLGTVPAGDRHEAETWVLGADGVRARSLHDSGVDHYREPYPRSAYAPVPAAPEAGPAVADPAAGPRGPKAPPPAPSICLVMIVKDEAHVVAEGLRSVLPHVSDWVVVDTGSTDGTEGRVRALFESEGIPGHLFERPWRDFGTNRSEALALAREFSTSEYLWMLDADDLLEGVPELSCLSADAYHLRFGPGVEYWRLQIFRRTLPWHYVGVLHEYPACEGDGLELAYVDGKYVVHSRRLGSRSRDPEKYAKDAAILEEALAREPENARHAFYLGQSLYDAGQPERALEAFRRRAAMGGWEEEVFYSRYRAALCLGALGRPLSETLEALEECARLHPHRAEPLVRAASLARSEGRWAEAWVLARRAARIPRPGPGALFVETADYDYRALDEQALAAFHAGLPEESFGLSSELLEKRDLPDGDRGRVEANRDLAVPLVKDAFLAYDADLVRRLASRPSPGAGRVTLSVTTCRRLDLFTGTVCSFLNACEDLDLVDRFLCVDDGSSEEDRAEMRRLFPFFEFVFKGPSGRGHARSLNLVRDAVTTPFLLHLEDDWHFFARRPWVGPALEILDEEPELGQVLFNRNFAETLEDRLIPGGFRRRTRAHGHRYVVHEHHPPESEAYRRFQESHGRPSNAWWPHYSLRPSVLRTGVLSRLGPFDESGGHFELEYARRYAAAGFRSAFFDGVFALHTGRLTTERGDGARPNAYELNDQPQFGEAAGGRASGPGPARPRARVKLVGDWGSSRELLDSFRRQGKEDGRWDEVELTTDADADYFALFNRPGSRAEGFVPERTIVFPMEPPHSVARWGEWAAPDPRRFLQVRGHGRFPNAGEWHLARTWTGLREPVLSKDRGLSAVVSSRTADPGQKLRIGFLRFLQARGTPVDVFGRDNLHGLAGHRGPLPQRDKSDGLFPYRYTLAVENSSHPNYFTEKILDALLAECLPFYWGCPNLEEHLDPRAFVRLPLEDPVASRRVVEETMARDEWSARLEAIRREKRRILDELQLFPVLAKVVRGHRLASRLGVKVINLDRRPDRLASFQARLAEVAGPGLVARAERVAAVDGRALELTEGIRHTFRENDFGYRRSVVGCALSHLALWKELAAGEAPGLLVLEDDATLCHGFEGQLVELCGELEERHPAFDVLLLGCFDWHPRPEDDFEATRLPARVRPFEGSRYVGGTFAYVVSRRGASRLLAIVERDGIQNGIDRFVHHKEAELEIFVASPHVATATLVPPGSGLDSDIQNDFETLGG